MVIANQWDLSISGSYACHHTRDVRLYGSETINLKGNDIDTAPRRINTVQLGWQPGKNIRAELEWVAPEVLYRWVDNLHSYEGHKLFHLRVRQQLSSNLSVGLRINNLMDEEYADRADFFLLRIAILLVNHALIMPISLSILNITVYL